MLLSKISGFVLFSELLRLREHGLNIRSSIIVNHTRVSLSKERYVYHLHEYTRVQLSKLAHNLITCRLYCGIDSILKQVSLTIKLQNKIDFVYSNVDSMFYFQGPIPHHGERMG